MHEFIKKFPLYIVFLQFRKPSYISISRSYTSHQALSYAMAIFFWRNLWNFLFYFSFTRLLQECKGTEFVYILSDVCLHFCLLAYLLPININFKLLVPLFANKTNIPGVKILAYIFSRGAFTKLCGYFLHFEGNIS